MKEQLFEDGRVSPTHQGKGTPLLTDIDIIPLRKEYFSELKVFCDQEIGQDYFTFDDLEKIFDMSSKDSLMASLLAVSPRNNKIVGTRISFSPGLWVPWGKGFSTDKWKVKIQDVALFKSLFVSAECQGMGLGPQLSQKSMEILKNQGAKAIVSHSTLNSPNNSSMRYLQKLGFEEVKEHKRFWSDIDYLCAHCQQRPCRCDAMEMIYYL